MAYANNQLDKLTRCLKKIEKKQIIPGAVLLSGGGNDLAGDALATVVNHSNSGLDTLNPTILKEVIDVQIKTAYLRLITLITGLCDKLFPENSIPILIHGYSYPVPDGRGYLGGYWILPGPWLRPVFERKGHHKLRTTTDALTEVIDSFNEMLQTISSIPQFKHVRYVDVRGCMDNTLAQGKYKQSWSNELHPKEDGFELIAAEFHKMI